MRGALIAECMPGINTFSNVPLEQSSITTAPIRRRRVDRRAASTANEVRANAETIKNLQRGPNRLGRTEAT